MVGPKQMTFLSYDELFGQILDEFEPAVEGYGYDIGLRHRVCTEFVQTEWFLSLREVIAKGMSHMGGCPGPKPKPCDTCGHVTI